MTNNTDTTATARPANSRYTDEQLAEVLQRQLEQADKAAKQTALSVTGSDSMTQAAEWHMKAAVTAEAELRVLARALRAPIGSQRDALARVIGEYLDKSITSSDAFTNAVRAAEIEGAKRVLRKFHEEIDTAVLIDALV